MVSWAYALTCTHTHTRTRTHTAHLLRVQTYYLTLVREAKTGFTLSETPLGTLDLTPVSPTNTTTHTHRHTRTDRDRHTHTHTHTHTDKERESPSHTHTGWVTLGQCFSK